MYNNESINRIDDHRDYAHCRICLEGMGDEKLRQYCNCRGSLEAIHHNCLLKWVEASLAKNKTGIDNVSCQICNYQLNTVYSTRWKLKDCEEIKHVCSGDCSTPNTLLFIFTLFFLFTLIITVILLKSSTLSEENQKNYVYVIAFSTAFMTITLLALILGNIFKAEITIYGVEQIPFK